MMEHFARAFTALLVRRAGTGDRELAVAVTALANGLAEGHVCIDTAEDEAVQAVLPVLKNLRPVVGAPGDFTPLVLDGTLLYLGRYWNYERSVASAMRRLAAPVTPLPSVPDLRRHLSTLFPGTGMQSEQAFAALGAAVRSLAVVSGGPGTGKTTTVSRVLALKLLLRDRNLPYTIRLAAPTGKAADRMREAIVGAKRTLDIDPEILRRIPEEASTIHRLLGIRDGSGQPLHHAGDPIPADLVVLDEASMIDLSLMARLVDALRPGAGLILLGDRDQLDAVQPGSVFGELCGETTYSKELLALAAEVFGQNVRVPGQASGLTDSLYLLTKSYRFREDAGIGSLARAVNAGDDDATIAILRSDTSGALRWNSDPASAPDLFPADDVARWLKPYFELVMHGGPEAKCLQLFSAFRLLTPVREGPGSVQALNGLVEQWLRREGLMAGEREWYPGKPVMNSANNYTLGLYNGDVGITLPDERESLRVVFPGSAGTFRSYAPARLPAHDNAYATTVHKSQGSEFDEVLLLIPDAESPVVTRNLLYTAVTRARSRCTIWGSEEAVRAGTLRKPLKLSGLAKRFHDTEETTR